MQDQSKSEEPAEVEKDQQGDLLSSLGKVVVQLLDWRSLYLGKERVYLPGSGRLWTLDPYDNIVPCTLQPRRNVLVGVIGLLWGVVLLTGCLGRRHGVG